MKAEKRLYTEEEVRISLLEQSNIGILEALKKLNDKIDSIDNRLNDKIDSLDSRLNDKIDSMQKEMKSDFRWLFGIIIGLGGSLGAIMAHGFHWF